MNELCFASNLTSEQWAAWIQAFGSILAIIAAFLLSRKQFKDATSLQQAQAEAERKRRYEALIGFLDGMLEECFLALKALRRTDAEEYFSHHSTLELLGEFHQSLHQVSPLDMPSQASAKALAKLRDLAGTAKYNAGASFDEKNVMHGQQRSCAWALAHNLREMKGLRNQLFQELAGPPAVVGSLSSLKSRFLHGLRRLTS